MRRQAQRILVIGPGYVLDDSLCLLLKGDRGLRVSRLVYSDDAALLNVVSGMRPDVIVLVEDETVSAMKILNVLRSPALPAALRIVSVHEDDNDMEIYDRTGVTLTDSRDLLHFVRRDKSLAWKQRRA